MQLYVSRYTLPQRRIQLAKEQAIEMAKNIFKIYESTNDINSTDEIASNPFSLFCETGRFQGYTGDQVGEFPMKFCNKFFPTPTDVGFCMTKDVAANNIIKQMDTSEYSDFMEVKEQNLETSSLEGTYSAESTDILMTNTFDDGASLNIPIARVRYDFHFVTPVRI